MGRAATGPAVTRHVPSVTPTLMHLPPLGPMTAKRSRQGPAFLCPCMRKGRQAPHSSIPACSGQGAQDGCPTRLPPSDPPPHTDVHTRVRTHTHTHTCVPRLTPAHPPTTGASARPGGLRDLLLDIQMPSCQCNLRTPPHSCRTDGRTGGEGKTDRWGGWRTGARVSRGTQTKPRSARLTPPRFLVETGGGLL